jgi:hypothetical protein
VPELADIDSSLGPTFLAQLQNIYVVLNIASVMCYFSLDYSYLTRDSL